MKHRTVVYISLILAAILLLLAVMVWEAHVTRQDAALEQQSQAALALGKEWHSQLLLLQQKRSSDSTALARAARARTVLADSALQAHERADSLGVALAQALSPSDSVRTLLVRVALDSGAVMQLTRALEIEKQSTARLRGMVQERDTLLQQADKAISSLDLALAAERSHRRAGCFFGWCPSRLTVGLVSAAVGYAAGAAH